MLYKYIEINQFKLKILTKFYLKFANENKNYGTRDIYPNENSLQFHF